VTDRLTRMFEAQLELQRTLGSDPTTKSGEERVRWIEHMTVATIAELMEVLQEVSWKSWASAQFINESAALNELRDAWQFLTNLMFTVYQVTPAEMASELEERLQRKIVINQKRHDENYDGLSAKCPGCHRALDEVTIREVHVENGGRVFLCVCGNTLSSSVVMLSD
jgi:hypothetical protein